MVKTVLQGKLSHKACSLATLYATTIGVLARRAIRRPRVKEWGIAFEISTVFFRRQFNRAFAFDDIAEGRAYLDSLFTVVEADPAVDSRPSEPGEPPGTWFVPREQTGTATMLYFHGGGYTFDAAVSQHFIAMLAEMTGIPIFAPTYRLTPEHAHPAQLDDAVAAYRWLLHRGTDPAKIVVCGDSAGGHLVLMTLAKLLEVGLPQPSIGIALSPWTDIGERGASQFGHDRYDLVQGYQTLQFGRWLRGDTGYTLADLSPIDQDFRGAAPIYLQAGGKEILVDMIRDFAAVLANQGTPVRLDVWTHMVHEFHAYGNTLPDSRDAIQRIRDTIAWATARTKNPPPIADHTELDTFWLLTTSPPPRNSEPSPHPRGHS